MKKFTLLFVLLLPFFGFSQVDLVRWNSSDFTPTTTADFVTGYAINPSTVSLQANNYGITDTFFQTSNWPSSNTPSDTHYIQFRANADNGFKINASSFNFKAKTTSAPMKLKVVAAKNANFNNPTEILSETNVTGSYVNYTASFPANFTSNANGNIFVRIYVYGTNNSLLINYDNGLTTGPVLKGTLTTDEVYAVNDIVNIDKNTSSSINVLANDYSGTGSFTSVSNLTTPTNAAGTVTVNANNTIQFVPATGFTGSSTFNYKISNNNGSSSIATVTVNISEPALAEWNLSSNSNVTFQQSYVSATNLSFIQFDANYSALGMAISHTEDANFQHYRAFDLKIKPNAGSVLNVTNLVFEQERLAANSAIGASNYQIKYKIVTGNFTENTDSFFNTATVLINDESVVLNPVKNIPFNITLNENQTLVVRFYARGGNDYNFNGWRIKANTLKLRGSYTQSCTPPPNTQDFGNDKWNGYVYTYTGNNTDFSTATYIGTVTESKNFFRDMAAGQVAGATTNIPCVTPPSDRFMIRYKMTTPSLVAGQYNFTVGADDGYRLYIDGALQADLSDFTDHGYNQKSKTISLSAGAHNLIYEYYEKTGDATVMFSYGKVDASSFPFGNNVWNVYAFNSDTNATASTYAGSYVDSNLGINTEAFWANGTSPSATNTYSGAPVPKDYFTTVFKRKGFPCGKFSIKLNKFDDDVVIILNGTQIESKTGTGTNYVLPNNYILKPTDEIEVRLVERGGAAFLNMAFIDVPTVYNASSTPTAAQVLGTSMRVEKNFSITENLNVCSCTVTNGYTLTIPENKTITVQEGVTVENSGNLIVENNGSLVQVNDNATNSGSINVKRTTAPVKRYDFTYWSSPVGSGFTLANLSPNTLGDKYYSYNPVSGWVIHYNGNQAMEAGKGYLVRAPQEYDINNAAVYNATFIGKPNNGIVTQPIVENASNLIGNPYPSAISADAIFSANSGVIDGTFYFWTHNSLPSTANSGNATYNYSSDDYASYNGVGGVKTKSAVTGGQTPTGNIASGQSFFIAGKTNGNVTFSNSMRVKAGNNSQFFRTSNSTQSEEEEPVAIEKNRLWLNISNEAGDFNETLIGYVSNATNGLDKAFDGVNLSSGTTTLYSIIDTNNLVIQGRALPFTNTDVVPLGMKISTAGQYTINMDQFDGLFTSQNIYLFDNLTNTTHDLKASDYVFNSEAGTFNSRFEIRYVNGTELGIDTPIVSNNDVIVYKSGNQIAVKATNFTIDNVKVYDLTGKVIFSKAKVNSNEFATSGLNVGTQVVIVKVNLDNNQSVSKKVIMN